LQNKKQAQLMLTNPRDAFMSRYSCVRGHSRSSNMVPCDS